ncbi:ATP-binding protein [Gelidibacter pelagius]|uniref:ATP-binding protein n=1 Tax=Gelidibacter pelagius TaxID=2819985 RepID=A0ABS3SSE0_9FLAO|nr:ATP-binding protein [Gelidibacter pelagius]MBO3097823.1 ATP-binding protein [Gelidibacter pelagius]
MSEELVNLEAKVTAPVNLIDIKFDLQKQYLRDDHLSILSIDKLKNEVLLSQVSQEEIRGKIRFFQMQKFVYEKDVKITNKLKSVFTTLHSVDSSVIFKIDSNGTECNLYIGVKSGVKVHEKAKVLKGALEGNFPGTKFSNNNENLTNQEVLNINNEIFNNCKEVTAVVGIPSLKDKEEDQFFQGIENLILGMNSKPFSAFFIADPVSSGQVELTLDTYEQIYSVLSSEKEFVVTESENTSISESISYSTSKSTSVSHSTTLGTSETKTTNSSPWIGRKMMNGFFGTGSKTADSLSKGLEKGVNGAVKYGTALGGAILGTVVAGAPGAIIGGKAALDKGKELSEGLDLKDKAEGSKAVAASQSETDGLTEGHTDTDGNVKGNTSGTSNSRQKTYTNKRASNFLDQLDKQIERLVQGKGVGFWNVGVYFVSDEEQNSIIAANIYNGITKGAESNFETAAIKTFNSINKSEKDKVVDYLQRYEVPRIVDYGFLAQAITTDELTVQMNFPHKSVVGLDVVEIIPFGNNPKKQVENNIKIGQLYNYEQKLNNDILLDYNKFTSHIFVTGSTGSGKSNVTYNLIDKLCENGINFLVIEPAKGEYKEEFGGRENVSVYGTNSAETELLRINPFSFPKSIHIYEHIDRFIEILNACWPMEAAMPNILKEAIEDAYISKGWLLDESRCIEEEIQYPLFSDLLESLENVIAQSKFSEEVKSNYEGALVSRVRSMTNGLNKLIFTNDCISDEDLFDKNVIVDLSRVASSEGKALFMGILFMRLNEYRIANKNQSNSDLKHITIIEEAHNLLKRTSSEQSSSSANLAGKSVEMISNAIAEMRTYGEGFIIADQAPGLLDMSVIRNTNTKICLRLPDFEDRKLVGSAMNLSDDQIKELAKLETGVAAIYQNDWQEAILCKFDKFESQNDEFTHNEVSDKKENVKKVLEIISNYEKNKEISESEVNFVNEVICLDFLLRQEWKSNTKSKLKIELLKKLISITGQKDVDPILKYVVHFLKRRKSDHILTTIKLWH